MVLPSPSLHRSPLPSTQENTTVHPSRLCLRVAGWGASCGSCIQPQSDVFCLIPTSVSGHPSSSSIALCRATPQRVKIRILKAHQQNSGQRCLPTPPPLASEKLRVKVFLFVFKNRIYRKKTQRSRLGWKKQSNRKGPTRGKIRLFVYCRL